MIHWLQTAFSTYVLHVLHNNGYQWWSGMGANFALLTIALGLVRRHNCSVRWCFRLGKHPVDGTSHVVCRKHHPDDHPKHYSPQPEDLVEDVSKDRG